MTTASTVSCIFLLFFLSTSSLAQSNASRVLIYSATAGFRHDSIPTAIESLKNKAASANIIFDATEDKTQFRDNILDRYDAIMFLILDDDGKAAFQKYLNNGGNFMGVHSASDCLVNTTFYGQEVGAYFDYHADLQHAIVDVIDSSHPSTSKLPAEWKVQDEMYNFKSDPRTLGAKVVLAADESSYIDKGIRKFDQGTPHPIAWFQSQGAGAGSAENAGRSFYTSLGHLNETWQDDLFLSHVLGGLSWVLESDTTRAMNPSTAVGNSNTVNSNPTTTATGEVTTTSVS
ncbi:class I glutamine amidotransferase-like protein [Collybia nuda]|uniref:Class I glutamine amidotransferase-like protein n=1 Tax=Collybia nuda TaxID=64659 RepID=A0A9P5YDK4_9AGAR|nr:class I glutamine amidotransferase-like protein [Collybia nuda]